MKPKLRSVAPYEVNLLLKSGSMLERFGGIVAPLEKEAMLQGITRGVSKGLSNVAVKMGLKPSFREMLKIRRGLNVTQDMAGGGTKTMNGARGASSQPLVPLPTTHAGLYDPASRQVRLAAGAGSDTLRHEVRHAYQDQGGGLMGRMFSWRSAPGASNTLKGSIGNAAIEAQAQMAGHRGVLGGLKAWGQVAPQYAPYYNATGVAAMPYHASRAVGQIASNPGATAGVIGATGTAAAGDFGNAPWANAGGATSLAKQAAFEGCSEKQLEVLGRAFGVGPRAKLPESHYRECPQCHEKKARVKEIHADTGMDGWVLKCDACGKSSDMPAEKFASSGCPKCGNSVSDDYYDRRDFCPDCQGRSTGIKSASVAAAIRRARNETHTDPTPAQAEAGNYAKGELRLHNMIVKIENPKGTTRRGYHEDGTTKYERVMSADYGYFKSTKAADGDAVDCFIGPNPDSELVVVIDQYRGDVFDEHKCVLGIDSQDAGEKLYLAHYQRGWKLGPVSTTTVAQLKEWLKNGDTKKPFKGQMVKAAARLGWIPAIQG